MASVPRKSDAAASVVEAATPTASAQAAQSRIVHAALAEFTEYGMRRVSVDDIAKRAGLHRVTVYKHFKNKDEVLRAAVLAWAQEFFARIAAAVQGSSREDVLIEGFVVSMRQMRDDPLVSRVLQSEPEVLLPYVTVDGGAVVAAVRDFFAAQLRAAKPARRVRVEADLDAVAELVARAGLSFVLTPQSHIRTQTDDQIREFARTYLAPMLG